MAKPNSERLARILNAAFRRKQSHNPAYSLRALARDLGVSPAFVSNMMNGKKLPPRERLEKLCYCLELDVPEREIVVKAVMLDSFSAKILSRPAKKKAVTRGRAVGATNKNLLSSWLNIALLEGLTLDAPYCEIESLRNRLGVSAAEIKRALENLHEAGMIEEAQGSWRKKDDHVYLAGGRSRQEVRDFHGMMIAKAGEELVHKTSQAEYERRLINGFTFALNPAHLERLKAKVIQFLDDISQEAGEGHCEEVYQCNFQLFPLTKKA